MSQAQSDQYPDAEAPTPEFDSDEWKHDRYYLDEVPARTDSTSPFAAATDTAEGLAGVLTEPPWSSSSQSEYSGSAPSGHWPLRMAACIPQGDRAVQPRIVCRPGRAYRKHEASSRQARKWRSSSRLCSEAACQYHLKKGWAALK